MGKLNQQQLAQIAALPLAEYVNQARRDQVPPAIPFGNPKDLEEVVWVYVLSSFLAERVDEIVHKIQRFQKKNPGQKFDLKIEVKKR